MQAATFHVGAFLREHARLLATCALLAPFAYCALQLFARFA